jgi:hypothetical protein
MPMALCVFIFGSVILIPAVTIACMSSALRGIAGWSIPVAIALQYFFFLVWAAMLYKLLPLGEIKLLVVIIFSAISTYIVATYVLRGAIEQAAKRSSVTIAALGIAAVLATVSLLPDLYLFVHEGYFPQHGSILVSVVYGDQIRHGHLIRALVREDQSAYFPHSQFIYEVLWHHGMAVIDAVLPASRTGLSVALGGTLVVGWLLYFLLYWLVGVLRPTAGTNWPVMVLVALLALSNTDWYGLLFMRHWGEPGSLFRYFSIRLLASTAPQHASYVVMLLPLVAFYYRPNQTWQKSDDKVAFIPSFMIVFAIAAIVISPVDSAITVPSIAAIAAAQLYQRPRATILVGLQLLVAAIAAAAIFWVVLRFPIYELFIRPGIAPGSSEEDAFTPFWRLTDIGRRLALLPLVFVITMGTCGILVSLLFVWWAFEKPVRFRDPIALALLGGSFFWNIILVNGEIQRHFSMLAAIAILVLISLALPLDWHPWKFGFRSRVALKLCSAIAAILIAIQLIEVFTVKGSSGDPTIDYFVDRLWAGTSGRLSKGFRDDAANDYFCINDFITRNRPGLPVVAAQAEILGFPFAAEVTTALMPWRETVVHQRVTPDQSATLFRINRGGNATLRAMAVQIGTPIKSELYSLGFRAIIWGPHEDRDLGEASRRVLITSEETLARCGSVGLFTLTGGENAAGKNLSGSGS